MPKTVVFVCNRTSIVSQGVIVHQHASGTKDVLCAFCVVCVCFSRLHNSLPHEVQIKFDASVEIDEVGDDPSIPLQKYGEPAVCTPGNSLHFFRSPFLLFAISLLTSGCCVCVWLHMTPTNFCKHELAHSVLCFAPVHSCLSSAASCLLTGV